MVLLIAAVGKSGSGKTTTIEYLISKLSCEGYRIAAIKHIHISNFTIDKEGTNTWRFAKAGSKITVAISPEELALIKKTAKSPNQLEQAVELLSREQLDIIFIEGFRHKIAGRQDILKIITAKNQIDLEQALNETVQPILAITGLVLQSSNQKSMGEIPFIKIPSQGEQLVEIIRHLIKKSSQGKN
jgi:molybdopterin-guanine dinucleotide biosynthesis protein MobB